MKWPLIAGVAGAVVATLFALPVAFSGEVYVPGRIWTSGYFRGTPAYVMAASWLCLSAASLFAGLMPTFPKRYFAYRRRRDIALVAFAALFVVAVIAVINQKMG
jgi:hypothetical protein